MYFPDGSLFLFLILSIGIISTAEKGKHHKERVYHGLIKEDANEGTKVQLDHPLMVRNKEQLIGDEICGYTLYKSHSELPFEVRLKESRSKTGAADVILAPGYKLNFERRHKYSFEVAAHDCVTGQHIPREKIHIEVEDVNEYAPNWKKDSYVVEVVEGKVFDQIVQLEATDDDGSDNFSSICHYHILTPDVPFIVNKHGILRNTERLDFSKKHNFILEIKAEDCGGKVSRTSDKIMVNIVVKETCKVGWKGVEELIEYEPGSNQHLVAEKGDLELCDHTCRQTKVSARVKLTTKHIGKGCDRDTYSIHSQRKLCGAASGSIDLLPSTSMGLWSSKLPTDNGRESDQIFSFDGKKNAVEVPSSKLNHTFGDHFTVAMWMKHAEDPEDPLRSGTKENILCNSDLDAMNRHHFSLFVHNCRLVLLLRQEPHGQDMNTFKPAEWRWAIPQVCDQQWHHYAVSVDFPQVRLYIDGKLYVVKENKADVIDDWPIHKSAKVSGTKLVIGACWHGGEKRLSQHFKGFLADLSLLPSKTESARVIQCLNNCKEKLDFHAMSEMESGMSVSFNSEMTEITISGQNHTGVQKLVRRIGYINSRVFPTPGHRALSIETDVTCNNGKKLTVPDVKSQVMVLKTAEPIITISGTPNMARKEHDLVTGQKIFHDVTIVSRTRKEAEEEKSGIVQTKKNVKQNTVTLDTDDKYKVDSCRIEFSGPQLDRNVEYLKYPENLMKQLDVQAFESNTGLIIAGTENIFNYVEIIRQIHYINIKPEDLNSRTFVLTCSELNGRFVSNAFTVKLDVLHISHEHMRVQQAIGHNQVDSKAAEVIKPVKHYKPNSYTDNVNHVGASTGVGMVVIIVICVGFLVFMIVLGIIRIRAAHRRTPEVSTVDDKQEMEWDNSALTITVNPMEQENMYCEDQELNGLRVEDTDSEDEDDVSITHDELESSEEEAEKVKDHELEWDDSTLRI